MSFHLTDRATTQNVKKLPVSNSGLLIVVQNQLTIRQSSKNKQSWYLPSSVPFLPKYRADRTVQLRDTLFGQQ